MPIRIRRRKQRQGKVKIRLSRKKPQLPPLETDDDGFMVMTFSEFHTMIREEPWKHPYFHPIRVVSMDVVRALEANPRVESIRVFQDRILPKLVDGSLGKIHPDIRWRPKAGPGSYSSLAALDAAEQRCYLRPAKQPQGKLRKRRMRIRLKR